MEIILIFAGAFIVALSGALMPGPLLTITIAQSMKKGFIAGPLIILGHMILELVLLVGLILGLKKFLLLDTVMKVTFILGGVILIAMGLDLFVHGRKAEIKKDQSTQFAVRFHPVINGIIVSLSNPYWIVWWVTIGLGYLIKAMKYKFLGIAVFFTGHILADLIWYSFVSFSFSKGKKFISDKAYHIIILICGIFLVFFGIWFLYGGIKQV